MTFQEFVVSSDTNFMNAKVSDISIEYWNTLDMYIHRSRVKLLYTILSDVTISQIWAILSLCVTTSH